VKRALAGFMLGALLLGSLVSSQATRIQLVQLAQSGATTGQYIKWNGTKYAPFSIAIADVTSLQATLDNKIQYDAIQSLSVGQSLQALSNLCVSVASSTSGQVLTSTGTVTCPTWQTPSGGGGSSVTYTAQTLTVPQAAQARANIGLTNALPGDPNAALATVYDIPGGSQNAYQDVTTSGATNITNANVYLRAGAVGATLTLPQFYDIVASTGIAIIWDEGVTTGSITLTRQGSSTIDGASPSITVTAPIGKMIRRNGANWETTTIPYPNDIRYDVTQSLSATQKTQALSNIGLGVGSSTVGQPLISTGPTTLPTYQGTLSSSVMPAMTGDVTAAVNTHATTITSNAVTNAKAAQMPANTIKCNATAATANATDCTSIPPAVQGGLVAYDDPTWYGAAAWATNPHTVNSTQALASGVIRCSIGKMAVTKASGSTVTIIYDVSTAGATLTAGQNLIGIYNAATVNGSYTLRGTSAAQETVWNTTGQKVTAAITLSGALTIGDFVSVCYLAVGTTAPTLRSSSTLATFANFANKLKLISATGKTALDSTYTISTTASGTVYAATTNAPWWALQ
jgi:hypothetical protein